MFVADLITTILNAGILHLTESNALYRASGSLVLPILFNVIVIGLLFFCVHSSYTNRFILFNTMWTVIIIRCFAVYNNITWLRVPKETVMQIASEVTKETVAATTRQFAVMTYLPLFVGIIAFMFWRMDHYVVKKNR